MSMALNNRTNLVPFFAISFNGVFVDNYYKQFITGIEFQDSDCEASLGRINVFDRDFKFTNKFDFYKGVKVKLYLGFEKNYRLVLEGEVTHFQNSGSSDGIREFTIGFIDKSNAMNSVQRSDSWTNSKVSDVVAVIARRYGFKASIQDTKEIVEKISQDNETDAQFLKKLAEDEAFEFYIFPDKKMFFFGDKFTGLTIKDYLNYASGDCTITDYNLDLVERNKKEKVDKDGHKSSDKSHKSGGSSGSGNGSGGSGGDGSGNFEGGVNVEVEVEDPDEDYVGIIGMTGGNG